MPDGGQARLDQDPLRTSMPEAERYRYRGTVVQERGSPGHGTPEPWQESGGGTEGEVKP
jgi:hypothetical protein